MLRPLRCPLMNTPIGAALWRGVELDLDVDRRAADIHDPDLGPWRVRKARAGRHPRVADARVLALGWGGPVDQRSRRRSLKDIPLQGHVGDRTPGSEFHALHAVLC